MSLDATQEDMNLFPNFLYKIWSRMGQDGALCISPPSNSGDSSAPLPDHIQISAREQARPYPLFVNAFVQEKILRQQQKFHRQEDPWIKNECGHLIDSPMIESKKILTVGQHRSLAMKTEARCRLHLKCKTFSGVSSSNQMNEFLGNEDFFWKMMKYGL